MSNLTPTTVNRLAFIRFLYQQGVEQSHRPEPLSATGLLCLHDAVELFLRLAGEHLTNLPTSMSFIEYWDRLSKLAPPVVLPNKNAMDRMNKLRVNLKHHGSIPSATDLEQVRADVSTFFRDATKQVFGIDFLSIDMVDLVTQLDAKTLLGSAEARKRAGDCVLALADLRDAFDWLLRDYANRKRLSFKETAYSFGEDLSRLSPVDPLLKALAPLVDSARSMQSAMRVLAVGIDYRRYAKFAMLTPTVIKMANGDRHIVERSGLQPTGDHYDFCRNFVISSAIHLAAEDFDLDLEQLWLATRTTIRRRDPAPKGPTTETE